MDFKNRVQGFFLKEKGLKHQRIQKVAFPEKMQISFILVSLAAPLIFQLCFWYLQEIVVVSCYLIMGIGIKIIF